MNTSRYKWLMPVLMAAGMAFTTSVPATADTALLNDGPYAFYLPEQEQVALKWLCGGQVVQRQQALQQTVQPVCGYPAALQLLAAPQAVSTVKFQADKLAVLSDVHGQFAVMRNLLQKQGIINQQLQWQFGTGHLVIVGDIVDRGEAVTESLWLLYQLEQQAREAGGQVHLLLGNHETMVLYDDVRYVNAKYLQVAQQLGTDYSSLFSKDTVLGAWLRSKPVLIQINDMLFVHAGLHPDYMALDMTLSEVNEHFRQSLGVAKNALKEVPILNFLYGSLGPIWYRGYFREQHAISDTQLTTLLRQLNISRIVVGHTSMDGIYSHHHGKVISVDSSIKKGQSGQLLLWNDKGLQRGLYDGRVEPVPAWTAR